MPNTASSGRPHLTSLLERVEKATGPDRELDAAIRIALFPPAGRPAWLPYTASLDACRALQEQALPGWDWSARHSVSSDGDVRYGNAVVWVPCNPRDDESPRYWASHEHAPELAWLAAILRALIAQPKEKEGACGT